jgi:Flp pilus assembly protein TadG
MILRPLNTLVSAQGGNAAIEFALLAPILALLICGLADIGGAVNLATKLDSAARAGAVYAGVYPTDTDGITQAAKDGTSDGNMSISLSSSSEASSGAAYCTCGSSTATTILCSTGTCTGSVKNVFVTVTTTQTYSPILPYGGVFGSLSMSGKATVQVQ